MTENEKLHEQIEICDKALRECAEGIAEAGIALEEVFKKAVEYVAEAFEALAGTWDQMWSGMLENEASPFEWYMMNHAKRYRVRKKYEDRVTCRVLEKILRGGLANEKEEHR